MDEKQFAANKANHRSERMFKTKLAMMSFGLALVVGLALGSVFIGGSMSGPVDTFLGLVGRSRGGNTSSHERSDRHADWRSERVSNEVTSPAQTESVPSEVIPSPVEVVTTEVIPPPTVVDATPPLVATPTPEVVVAPLEITTESVGQVSIPTSAGEQTPSVAVSENKTNPTPVIAPAEPAPQVPVTVSLDTIAPSTPTGLLARVLAGAQLELSWNESTDNKGVTKYVVYRCQGKTCTPGTQIGSSVTGTFSDTNISKSTTYNYRVRAMDAAENYSGYSSSVRVGTLGSLSGSTKFTLGAQIVTNDNLNSRLWPSLLAGINGLQSKGSNGTVLAGPYLGSNLQWWYIDYATGNDGWSAEDYLSPLVLPAPQPTPLPTVPASTTPPTPTPVVVTETPPSVTTLNAKFGVSVGDTLPSLSDSELNKTLDDLVALRVGWVRFDIAWSDVQYNNSAEYDWKLIDRIITAMKGRGLQMLPIITYTPTWARGSTCTASINCAPADTAKFAKFAGEVVKRYSPQGIHTWEIWNEPNMGNFWQPLGNVRGYAKLLKETSVAIKAVDSTAFIVTGGVGPAATNGEDVSPLDFVEQLYLAGAGPYFDAIGDHPYSYPVPASYVENWNAWSQMALTGRSIRSIMTENGDAGKPIWITEYGAPTGGTGVIADVSDYHINDSPTYVTEALQAAMLEDAIRQHAQLSWAGPLFWYSYIDQGTDRSTIENFFGILRADGSKKPSYVKLQSLLMPQ